MIVMVTSLGVGYTAADGLNVKVPQLEKIHVSSGKRVGALVNSSSAFRPFVYSTTGNIVNLRLMCYGSGMVDDGTGVTAFDTVQFTVIADGY